MEKRNVFVQGDIFTVGISKKGVDLGAPMALDTDDFDAAVVDQSAPNFLRLLPMVKEITIQRIRRGSLYHDQVHCFLLREVTLHAQNTSWEEAGFVLESVVCAMVNIESAARLQPIQQPERS